MRGKIVLLSSLVVLLALAAGGCLFSPDDPKDDPVPPGVPFPGDRDQLMANFQDAYSGQDIDTYREVLAPGYEFILNPLDVSPGESDRFTCAEELLVAEHMFSGDAVGSHPGISNIRIDILEPSGPWTEVGPSDPDFPNTERGLYAVRITFSRADQSIIVVAGLREFYLSHTDTTVQGVPKLYYRLRGQRDLTTSSGSGVKRPAESTSWSGVKLDYK